MPVAHWPEHGPAAPLVHTAGRACPVFFDARTNESTPTPLQRLCDVCRHVTLRDQHASHSLAGARTRSPTGSHRGPGLPRLRRRSDQRMHSQATPTPLGSSCHVSLHDQHASRTLAGARTRRLAGSHHGPGLHPFRPHEHGPRTSNRSRATAMPPGPCRPVTLMIKMGPPPSGTRHGSEPRHSTSPRGRAKPRFRVGLCTRSGPTQPFRRPDQILKPASLLHSNSDSKAGPCPFSTGGPKTSRTDLLHSG